GRRHDHDPRHRGPALHRPGRGAGPPRRAVRARPPPEARGRGQGARRGRRRSLDRHQLAARRDRPARRRSTDRMAPRLICVTEAADALGLPVSGVEALADAGYLRVDSEDLVSLSEIKAFQAGNARSAGDTAIDLLGDVGAAGEQAEALLAALAACVADMAGRAADVVAATFSEAADWTDQLRRRSVRQARLRFEVIVTLT